jgi:hypothetical protein
MVMVMKHRVTNALVVDKELYDTSIQMRIEHGYSFQRICHLVEWTKAYSCEIRACHGNDSALVRLDRDRS